MKPLGKKRKGEELEDFIASHARYMANRLKLTLACCDSPLEQLLAMAILNKPYIEMQPRSHWAGYPFASDGRLHIYLQYPTHINGRSCRLDFAFISSTIRLNVEVDGHEFHERTKEQARRDRSRDRELTADGWTVLRFTGQEVWADALGCVDQIWNFTVPGKEPSE